MKKQILNKLIILLCIITMSIAPVHITAYSETSESASSMQDVLVALGIINYDSYGEIDAAQELTRAEFIGITGRFLNINPTVVADKTYFVDVPSDSWYTHTLNTMTELNIISVPENRIFDPDRIITTDEAVKIIVCILGYNEYALEKGGYPAGYYATASGLGLLKNVKGGGNLNNGKLVPLLYNALDANVHEIIYFGEDFHIQKTDRTILEIYRDVYANKGIVQTVKGISLNGFTVSEENEVVIDGNFYDTGEIQNIEEFFGCKVKFYYEKNSNDERTILYVEKMSEEMTVLSDDYVDYDTSSGSLSYYDGKRLKNINIDKGAVVIKNGSIVSEKVDEAFDIQNGEIKLIKSESDKYDVVIIYDYTTIVAGIVNIDGFIIIDEIDATNIIDVSPNKCEYLDIYSADGDKIPFGSITVGAVLDVALSDNHARIYVNTANVKGTVKGISASEKRLRIDENTYEYLDNAISYYNIEIGSKGIFKTNKYGKIASFGPEALLFMPGYVIGVADTEGLANEVQIKLFSGATGIVEIYTVSSKVKIDGVMVKDGIYARLANLKDNIIIYELNSSGEIGKIDTIESGTEENGLRCILPKGYHRYNSASKMLGRTVVCSSDIIVLNIPYHADEREDNVYTKGTLSDLVNNQDNYVECYSVGDTPYCNLLINYRTRYRMGLSDQLIMVEEIYDAVDANGNSIAKLHGWQAGNEVEYDIVDEYENMPTKGDVIRVGKDENSVVGMIDIHYDFETNAGGIMDSKGKHSGYGPTSASGKDIIKEFWNAETYIDVMGWYRVGFGYPIEIEKDLLKWSFEKASDNVGEVVQLTSSLPIVVYDVEKDRIFKGNISDIKTKKTYGDKCSTIIASYQSGKVTAIYVINR